MIGFRKASVRLLYPEIGKSYDGIRLTKVTGRLPPGRSILRPESNVRRLTTPQAKTAVSDLTTMEDSDVALIDASRTTESRNSRSLKTREVILEACARQFALRGYHGVSTRELAREAGVNEVTLFRHFANKAEVYRAVLISQINQLEIRDVFLTRISRCGDLKKAISLATEAVEDAMAGSPQLGKLLLYSFLEQGVIPAPEFRMRIRRALNPVIIALSVWAEAHDISEFDPYQTVTGILAQLLVRDSLSEFTRPEETGLYPID